MNSDEQRRLIEREMAEYRPAFEQMLKDQQSIVPSESNPLPQPTIFPKMEMDPDIEQIQRREELTEALADYAHEAWSGWMKYMLPILNPLFKVASWEPGDPVPSQESFEKALSSLERWIKQMQTPYDELPEEMRLSDRAEARRMVEIMDRYNAIPADYRQRPRRHTVLNSAADFRHWLDENLVPIRGPEGTTYVSVPREITTIEAFRAWFLAEIGLEEDEYVDEDYFSTVTQE